MNISRNRHTALILTFFVILFITGCSLWSNFTTYFNLYYNTVQLFNQAEEQILNQKRDLFSTEELIVPGSATSDLVKVIEKCSKILQFHSETAYFEDALFLLGKSFYYQKNYQKSQRKFIELLAANPNTDYALEAELWIGKCQMKLRNYGEGLTTLSAVREKAIEERKDKIVSVTYIEEIVHKISSEDFSGAIELANEFINVSKDNDIKAEVWYEIGNLNMKIEDIPNAIIAYQNVFNYSPDFDLEFETKLKYGRALRLDGQYETALELFEDMKREDKYSDNYAEIDFEIGKSLFSVDRFEEAIDQLIYVDTTYKSNPVSGGAKYEIGYIYETALNNYDSAIVYYKKAGTAAVPQGYSSKSKEKYNLFNKYQGLRSNIDNYERQLYYLINPEEFIKDSIAYVQDSLAIAEEIANIKEFQEIWSGLDELLTEIDTVGYYQDTLKIIDTILTNKILDTLLVRDTTQILTRDSIFTKLRDPELMDTVVVTLFDSLFTNRELDPAARLRLEQRKREEEQRQAQFAQQLPDTLKFKNNPPRKSKIPIDSLKTMITKNQLELGNLFLTDLNKPDSAYWHYNNILTNYPNTTYQATALYSMGSYFLTVDEERRADSLFNIIYENYKNESIVNAAANRLNKPFIDLDYDPAKDVYAVSENLLLNGYYSDAIESFFDIFIHYPESPIAPKALYTCGWIMENELYELDSAAVFYDSLVANYPTSEYVKTIAPKLTLYKQEKRRLETAEQDSLASLQMAESDSLGHEFEEEFGTPELVEGVQDTTMLVLDEEQLMEPPVTVVKPPEERLRKEPVWNPRKRK
jgi:TolA-binding protein